MRLVTNKEISGFKILPFDLYDESSNLLLSAGEVLTPGKLIMLKGYTNIFTEEQIDTDSQEQNTLSKEEARRLANFRYEDLDDSDFETTINKDNVLPIDVQTKIKYFYKKTLDLLLYDYLEEGVQKLHELSGVIITDILRKLSKTKKCSQIRFMGEYELCHPLNVAIVGALIAKRLDYTNLEIEEVLLAGLLHDIGKIKLVKTNQMALTTVNEDELIQKHTIIGYDLIKNRLAFPENIAKAALEHHENNDGSGYPKGLSSDYISEIAQIINVANYYDNIACNRTQTHISSNRDVLRSMLEIGTKRFSAKVLYTFINMFTYDDPKEFADMLL